ncbi:hypothetical protein [Bartonella grahamii]|nr:hypothetical protein [Bartonella grahamii]
MAVVGGVVRLVVGGVGYGCRVGSVGMAVGGCGYGFVEGGAGYVWLL